MSLHFKGCSPYLIGPLVDRSVIFQVLSPFYTGSLSYSFSMSASTPNATGYPYIGGIHDDP